MFGQKKTRLPMFRRIRSEFQSLEGLAPNPHVWKDKIRIRMFRRIRSAFPCLERYAKNSNVWKD